MASAQHGEILNALLRALDIPMGAIAAIPDAAPLDAYHSAQAKNLPLIFLPPASIGRHGHFLLAVDNPHQRHRLHSLADGPACTTRVQRESDH